jgi:hypothetical protein
VRRHAENLEMGTEPEPAVHGLELPVPISQVHGCFFQSFHSAEIKISLESTDDRPYNQEGSQGQDHTLLIDYKDQINLLNPH